MNRFKELREQNHFTLQDLSDALRTQQGINISPDSLAKYERGERKPKIDKLEALADFFKVPVSYLRGEAVANRIKQVRKQLGLSLAEVGKGVGLATNTISRYETGEREPKLETWQKLANYFGVSVPSLMGLNEITTNKIYMFQGNNLGDYSFAVLATSETEAWELIKDRIASNKNQFLDDEFANDIRKYSISSIDLNDAAPQVIEDWKR